MAGSGQNHGRSLLAGGEEQQHLLHLAQADSPGGSPSAGAILANTPEWKTLEDSGVLQKGHAATLERFQNMSGDAKANFLSKDPEAVAALLAVLKVMDVNVCQYMVVLLYAFIKDDGSRYDALLTHASPEALYEILHRVLTRSGIEDFVLDRAASLFGGFVCHGGEAKFSSENVSEFVGNIVNGVYHLSEHGKLEAYCNLLKADYCRRPVWEARSVADTILKNVDPSAPPPNLYKATFCFWLLTFRKDLLDELIQRGALSRYCKVLRDCRVEKVIRVSINALNNMLTHEKAVEELLERNAAQMIQMLEYEKWRDSELGDTIRKNLAQLQLQVKEFSKFERYEKEVSSGKLVWSHLHQEKFFHEHVENFGVDDFRVVKQLVKLLAVDDPETVAVACHDLGEFVRLYPTGKKVLERLRAKQFLLMLLSHKNKQISREALLCVQKLMLRRWKDAAFDQSGPAQGGASGGQTATVR